MVSEKNAHGAKEIVSAPRDDAKDDGDLACGWGCIRPRWMQQFRTSKWILFWLCWAGGVQGGDPRALVVASFKKK